MALAAFDTLVRIESANARQTYLIVFQMVTDLFLRKELLTVPQSAHVFDERFSIRSGKIQQVCLENALANAYAGNHVPRLLYR